MTTTTQQHRHQRQDPHDQPPQHQPTLPPAAVLVAVTLAALTITAWAAVLLAGLIASAETIELAPAEAKAEQQTT